MSTLEDLSLPRVVLITDTDGADVGLAAAALTAVLTQAGTRVGSLRFATDNEPVVRE